MKVLLVITRSITGGAQVFVLNLARSLRKSGCEVEVAGGEGEFLAGELQKDRIRFHPLNSLKRSFSVINAVHFVRELQALIRKNRYEAVHLNSTHSLIGAAAGCLMRERPRFFFTFHGLSLLDGNYRLPFLLKPLASLYFRMFLKAVDGAIFECRLNYDEARKAGVVRAAHVVCNGLNGSAMTFAPAAEARSFFSERCGLDLAGAFLIGTTGRLVYQKNYEFLIESFPQIRERIPGARAVIIGDGPDRGKLAARIGRLGLDRDIFLIGEVKDSYRYMKGLDVFTLTSHYEGISLSLIEALFSGVPILASDVGGNRDVAGGCEHQIFTRGDADEYVRKLLYVREHQAELSQFNSSISDQFSLDRMTRDYIRIFEGLAPVNC